MIITDLFLSQDSLKPMWEQVEGVYKIIAPILNSSPEGAILIGHSQGIYVYIVYISVWQHNVLLLLHVVAGGLIFRGILETYPTHNITFISIATPLAGQYGSECCNDRYTNPRGCAIILSILLFPM